MTTAQESSPIIVLGAPRSGTTYLNAILNEHPDVFITHEARLFTWAHRSLRMLTDAEKAALGYRKQALPYMIGSFAALLRGFYTTIQKKGARHWGDKNPHYLDDEDEGCLDTIKTLFPESRFIHIIRDGRDVVTSLVRKQWVNFETAHRLWPSLVKRGCSFGSAQPVDRYYQIKYEDLIRDDAAVAASVFRFLNIPIHPRVLEFCHAQKTSRTPLSEPTRDWTADVQQSEWSRLFCPEEQLRSLELLGPTLIEHGYETETSLVATYRDIALQRRAIRIREAIASVVPRGSIALIISRGDEDVVAIEQRTGWHFPQTDDGTYAGNYPGDSSEAIAQLESLRRKGAEYLVIPWYSAWWLEHYRELSQRLRTSAELVYAEDDICQILRFAEINGSCSAGGS